MGPESLRLAWKGGTNNSLMYSSTPQLPFKEPQIPSNRDHKALNRGTLGGLGLFMFFNESIYAMSSGSPSSGPWWRTAPGALARSTQRSRPARLSSASRDRSVLGTTVGPVVSGVLVERGVCVCIHRYTRHNCTYVKYVCYIYIHTYRCNIYVYIHIDYVYTNIYLDVYVFVYLYRCVYVRFPEKCSASFCPSLVSNFKPKSSCRTLGPSSPSEPRWLAFLHARLSHALSSQGARWPWAASPSWPFRHPG